MPGNGLKALIYLDYICTIQIIFQLGSNIRIYKASQLFFNRGLEKGFKL